MSSAPYGLSTTAGAPVGAVISYAEISANVSVTATTEAAATTVATAPAFVADGSSGYWIEFFCPDATVGANAGGNTLTICLYQDGVSIGFLGQTAAGGTTTVDVPLRLLRKLTPSAGSHTYTIRAFRTNANCTINAGTGVITAFQPGYVLVTKAS